MHTIDVGPNLFTLGAAWLFLKYLLPVLIILVLIIGGYLLVRKLLTGRELTDINKNQLLLILAVGGIILVVLLS
jgi:flagellar biogenesis protein FliO